MNIRDPAQPARPAPAHVVLVRARIDPRAIQLFVVGAESGALAQAIAQRVLGPEVIVERGHPISAVVAEALNLKPREVRRF